MRRDINTFFFIVFLGVFCFFGCSSPKIDSKIKTVRIALWGTPQELDIVQSILKDWNKSHPNIRVRIEHSNYSGYFSKILTQVAGNVAPDIICTEVDMFVYYAENNIFESLNTLIEEDKDVKVQDFFPQIIKRFTVDGNVLVIPRDIAPFACIYYNKEIFDEAGVDYPKDDWSWEGLLSKSKALTKWDENGKIQRYGFYCWGWENFIYSNGGSLVDNVRHPTKVTMNEEKSIEGLQFYYDLIYKHKVTPKPLFFSNMGMSIHTLFSSKKLAMFCSGIWETPLLIEKTAQMKKEGKDFRWDVVMFPKGPSGIRAFGSGGSGYGILKKSKNKKEAWMVLKALCSKKGQARLSQSGLVQPSQIDIAKGKFWAENGMLPENKKMLNDAVAHVIFSPFHSEWFKIKQKLIISQLELAFNGKKTVRNAVVSLVDSANQALND